MTDARAPFPHDGRRRRRGFTLVEALIALALLAIGTAALMALQVRLRLVVDDIRHQEQALRLARNELERWRWRPDGPVPSLTWEGPATEFKLDAQSAPWHEPMPPGSLPADGPADGFMADVPPLRAVHLRVHWTDRAGRPRSLTLDSLLPAEDPALSGLLLLPPKVAAIAHLYRSA